MNLRFRRFSILKNRFLAANFLAMLLCSLVLTDSRILADIAVNPAGFVVAWGANDFGQATPPVDATNIVAVAAGDNHCLALRDDGFVIAWGNNNNGEVDPLPNVLTNHTARAKAISADGETSAALLTDGTVLVWGDNGFEQLNVPSEATNVIALAAGAHHITAVRADGSIVGWGAGGYGQNVPPPGLLAIAVAQGENHILALKNDGTVVGWGADDFGQSSPPTNLTDVVAIAANGNHSLALKNNGTVVAWGENAFGESDVPADLTNVVAIAAGQNDSLALLSDGTVVGWGQNDAGQTTPLPGLNHVTAIAAGNHHSAAVTTAPLIITRPPQNQSVPLGSTATFTVRAVGQEPISYQWKKGDDLIVDATNSMLVLNNIQVASEGTYSVIVSNAAATLTSSATLTIQQLAIVNPPQDQSVVVGSSATFSVTAVGFGEITYQWQKDGTEIPGATTSMLQLENVQLADEGVYAVTVSNLSLSISASAELHVCTAEISPGVAFFGTNGGASNVVVTVDGPCGVSLVNLNPDWIITPFPGPAEVTSLNYSVTPYTGLTPRKGTLIIAGRTLTIWQMRQEKTKPTVVITYPPRDLIVTSNSLTLAGKAADRSGVALVSYQQSDDEGATDYQPVNGTTNWSEEINLAPGTNVFHIVSQDISGNLSAVATRTIFYAVTNILTVQTNGLGSIRPNLNGKPLLIGKGYTLTAIPGRGQVFSNWSRAIGGGDETNFNVLSEEANLTFKMEPELILQANFVTNPFIATKGVYNGLFYETGDNGVTHHSSGFFTLTLAVGGTFSGRVLCDGDTLGMSGKFNAGGQSTFELKRARKSPLNVLLQLDVSEARTDVVNGYVETVVADHTSSNYWSADIYGNRAVYGGTNIFPRQGLHTMVVAGNYDESVPLGSGFGAVNIDRNGILHLAGELADGTKINQSVSMAKNFNYFQCPCYVPLYGNKGSIISWITLGNDEEIDLYGISLYGILHWTKPFNAREKYYRNGFTNEVFVNGSPYQPPANRTPALSLSNGVVVLEGGNLTEFSDPSLPVPNLTNECLLNSNNVFVIPNSTNRISLTLNKPTGTIKGSFLNPDTKRISTINGALLQRQNAAAGYFLGTNKSGFFLLQEKPSGGE